MDEKEKQLTISYIYQYEDMKKSFLENYFANIRNTIITIISGLGFLACLGMIIYLLVIADPNYFEKLFFILAALFFAFFLLRPFLNLSRIQVIWNSSLKIPKEFNLNFTQEQIAINRSFAQLIYQWNYFYQIIEVRNFFCFYFSLQEFFIVPKRVLTEEQIRDLILSSVNPQLVKVKIKN